MPEMSQGWPRIGLPLRRAPAFAGAGCLLLLGGTIWTGCDSERTRPTGNPADKYKTIVEPPDVPPTFSFAAGLREEFPEAAGFVNEFLQTCLKGDYSGYRKLVSRRREPEGLDRFTAIYHAIRVVRVESIERVPVPEVSDAVYRVVTAAEFQPGSRVSLRARNRSVAILVFQENGQWRMAPAPAALQPDDDPETVAGPGSNTAPAAPDYPWDDDGDH